MLSCLLYGFTGTTHSLDATMILNASDFPPLRQSTACAERGYYSKNPPLADGRTRQTASLPKLFHVCWMRIRCGTISPQAKHSRTVHVQRRTRQARPFQNLRIAAARDAPGFCNCLYHIPVTWQEAGAGLSPGPCLFPGCGAPCADATSASLPKAAYSPTW